MDKLSSGIILSFLITAGFDVALNLLPPPLGADILREYFDNHTILSAALIAGFVGAVTFVFIYMLFGNKVPKLSAFNMIVIFSISSIMGIPMRLSGLFPILDKYYYQKIPRIQSYLADGLSGIIVAAVYYFINFYVI